MNGYANPLKRSVRTFWAILGLCALADLSLAQEQAPQPNSGWFWNAEEGKKDSVLLDLSRSAEPAKRDAGFVDLSWGAAEPNKRNAVVVDLSWLQPNPQTFCEAPHVMRTRRPKWDVYDPCDALGIQRQQGRLRVGQEQSLEVLNLRSKWELPDPVSLRTDVTAQAHWRAEEAFHMSLPYVNLLFVYGQLGSSSDAIDPERLTVVTKTGVGLKVSPWQRTEVQLRGCTVLTYADPLRPDRVQERSEFNIEVLAKMHLIGPLQLEYNGTATPALSPWERDRLLQDVRVKVPLSGSSQFHVGARYRWQDAPTPLQPPWRERTELYMGLSFQH